MFETREGILKHCSKNNARLLGDLGERFLNRTQPGLEAQLADISDAVAYNNHDVDDGYRAGLISLAQLREQPLFEAQYREVTRRYPDLEDRRLIYEIIRRMINTVVTDLIETTRRNLEEAAPETIDDVRAAGRPLVGFSADIGEQHRLLKQFLHQHLYSHEQKLEMTRRVQTVLRDLFDTFMNDVSTMPQEFAASAARGDAAERARVVADYIAGMTDRYAFAEHERISG
jgi:dGTPase